MSKRKLVLLLSCVSVLLFASCTSFQEVALVNIESVQVKKLDKTAADFSVTAVIKNPNPYRVKLVQSDLDLILMGTKMGKARFDDKVTLEKLSTQPYTFAIHSEYQLDAKQAAPLFIGAMINRAIEVQLKGTVSGKARGLKKKIPVDLRHKTRLGAH